MTTITEGERLQRRFWIKDEILEEVRAQDSTGDSRHDPHVWIAKVVKHLGRAVSNDPATFRRSMVVIGALAVAAIEWYDDRWSDHR